MVAVPEIECHWGKIIADRNWQKTSAARAGRVFCIRDEFLNTPAPDAAFRVWTPWLTPFIPNSFRERKESGRLLPLPTTALPNPAA